MSSARLPGKVLADIAGRPMLHHVVSRAKQAKRIDLVAVATSSRPSDDEVEQFCRTSGTPCIRGSEDDVLDRYFQAAKRLGVDTVVRLTADCPLLDPEVIDRVVEAYQGGSYDYVSNTLECTYPDGLDTEVFSRRALERAWRDAHLPSEREHVTPYLRNHPELFRQLSVKHSEDLSGFRWTVDEPRDLELVRAVYAHFGGAKFRMADIVVFLRAEPHLTQLNAGIPRNAGYLKSLDEDRTLMRGPTR